MTQRSEPPEPSCRRRDIFCKSPLFRFDAESLHDLAGRGELVVEETLRARRRHSLADADIEAEAMLLLQQHYQRTDAVIYSDLDGLPA